MTVLGSAGPVFAEDLVQKYEPYFNLFTDDSGLTYKGLGKADSTGIYGLVLGINLKIKESPGRDKEWHWQQVAWSGNSATEDERFLIQICQDGLGEKYCWLNTVVYSHDLNVKSQSIVPLSGPFIIFAKDGDSNYTSESFITKFNALSGDQYNGKIYTSATTKELPNVKLVKGGKFTANLWYCATDDGIPNPNDPNNEIDGSKAAKEFTAAGITNDNVRAFGSLCGGTSYFKINKTPLPISIPSTDTDLNQQVQNGTNIQASSSVKPEGDNLPKCAVLGEGSVVGCLAKLIYYLLYIPSNFIAGLVGKIFDFFVGYSMSDETYRAPFVVRGWRIVRDISNIFFIIIMIWAGLSAVFNISKISLKGVVVALIVNAILINFSLFGTRLIIDASNIVARVFYSRIKVCDGECIDEKPKDGTPDNLKRGTGGYWPLSEKIVSSFNPQSILQPSLDSSSSTNQVVTTDQNLTQGQNDVLVTTALNKEGGDYAGYFIIVMLVSIGIMVFLTITLWQAAWIFLYRIIGFYVCMIFAPFAVLSRPQNGVSIPIVGNIEMISWKSWISDIMNYAMLAPIFIFFLYIIYYFLSTDFIKAIGITTSKNLIENSIHIIIPMLIILTMIRFGVKIAKKYSGEMGNMMGGAVQGALKTAGGFAAGTAIGIASGGLALGGRKIGAMAAKMQTDPDSKIGQWITRNQTKTGFAGKIAKFGDNALTKAQTSSFDLRQSGLFKQGIGVLGKKTGMNIKTDNGFLKSINLDTTHTAGGLNAAIDRQKKKDKDRVEEIETNFNDDAEGKKLAKQHYQNLLRREQADQLNMEAEEELKAQIKSGVIKNYTNEDVKKLVERKMTDPANSFEAYEKKINKKYGEVKDNKSYTKALRLRYSENIETSPSTSWDLLRSTLPLGNSDANRTMKDRAKNMQDYQKVQRKSLKTSEKAEKDLTDINATLNKIVEKLASEHPDSAVKARFSKYTNSKGEFDYTKIPEEDREEMVKTRREHLQDDLESHKLDVDLLKKNYESSPTETNKKAYLSKKKKMNELQNDFDKIKDILKKQEEAEEKVKGPKDEKKDDKK